MFELLAPVFAIAGGLLAGVPIFLHMFRRSPAIQMPFSVVRFLTPTLPKTTKRSKIEHWPLMLLRILAVILIALAFARPFQRMTVAKEAEIGNASRIALLLDASASMRRDGLREAVLAEIQNVVDGLNEEDTLSIDMYSSSTKKLVTAEEWQQTEPANRAALIERATTAYEPDWMSTHTANAMLEAADEVAREKGMTGPDGTRRVILITDFQEGSDLDELRSGTWPDTVKLDLRIVKPTQTGNAGLSLVEDERSGKIRVRVSNSGDAALTKYALSGFDAAGAVIGTPLIVEVGGGQRRTFTMPDSPEGQPPIAGVELLNEPHAFDNVVDLPIEDRGAMQIAHAGPNDSNNADTMRYYLQRALDGDEANPVEVVDLLSDDNIAIPVPANIQLAIVTESIPEGLVKSLEEMLKRNGTVLIVLKSTEMAASLQALLPANTGVEEASVNDYAMLGQMDFTGGLLSPFAEARFADFSSIRFWHYRRLTLDAKQTTAPEVLARFDSGDPAILEYSPSTGGTVFVLTSGWHPDDSQWALSTRFPPMIYRLLQLSNPRRSGHQLYEVGQRIVPEEISGEEEWTLALPDGTVRLASSSVTVPSDILPSVASPSVTSPSPSSTSSESDKERPAELPAPVSTNAVVLDQPGHWTLTSETENGTKTLSLLVTVAASESRTEPLPAGQLQALGMSADIASVTSSMAEAKTPAEESQLDARELESRQKFWRWLLVAGLACLIVESLYASWIERRFQMEPG